MRSLSSLPRTLLRLISYSVAGYSLVMVNSVTVLGTTELSSRPTEEEQKPQLKFREALTAAAHGKVSLGAAGSTWSWVQGSERSVGRRGKVHGRGMLELEGTLHAGSTSSFYRLFGAK